MSRFNLIRQIQTFDNKVKKFSQSSGLFLCAHTHQYIYENNMPYIMDQETKTCISSSFIAYLAKELLLFSSDTNREEMLRHDFLDLAYFYHNQISDSFVLVAKSKSPSSLDSFLIKITYEQFIYQQPIKDWIARTTFMFSICKTERVTIARSIIDRLVKDTIGIELTKYFRIGLALFFFFSTKVGKKFEPKYLLNSEIPILRQGISSEDIEKVISRLSCSNIQFRKLQEKHINSLEHERKYELNCLRKRPIITLKNGKQVAPFATFILEKITLGLYYDLMDWCNQNGTNFEKFSSQYGILFDEYVGELLSEKFNAGDQLFRADEYFKPKKGKTVCDWLILDNNFAIQIECKSSRLSPEIYSKGDHDKLIDFLTKRYLNKGKSQFSDTSDILTRKGFDTYSVIIYDDMFEKYNDLSGLRAKNSKLADQVLLDKVQFISIAEFEQLIPNLDKISFPKLLSKKCSTDITRRMRFGEFLAKQPDYLFNKPTKLLSTVWESLYPGSDPCN